MNCTESNDTTACSRIKDLPIQQMPREKLIERGPQCLSDAEIPALFICTGVRGVNAIQLGDQLIRRHGSISSIGAIDASELAKEHGLGLAKASRLVAAFELGARAARERMHTSILDSPQTIYSCFSPQLQHLAHEQVMVAVLDCRLRVLSTNLISIGSVNESIAQPRDIIRPVLARGAHGFVLVHNHPSGDPSPSPADDEVTRRVLAAAELMQFRFVDHVIIGRHEKGRQPWFSFRESSRIIK